ncbi:MAG: betaine--homocysteine S-methyltransferase [Pseudomonadota bacterium]
MTNTFTDLLASGRVLLADGATGTNLFAMGLQSGDAPELWNADYPDRISAHYRAFVDAGSDIVLTNTFGGNSSRLALHKAESRVRELNVAATRLLREVVEASGRQVAVAGSIGPTGDILEPSGPRTIAEATDIFREQAAALADAGVDVLWLETLSSREECQAAVTAAAETGLPFVMTMSFDTNGRTMMGLTPTDVRELQLNCAVQPAAWGGNCGLGASEVIAALMTAQQQAPDDGHHPVLVAKANCGIPQYEDGKIVYSGTPEVMTKYTTLAIDAGARIIGGCCGTTPAHIKAMREQIDSHERGEMPTLAHVEAMLGEVTDGTRDLASGQVSRKAPRTSRRRPVRRAS